MNTDLVHRARVHAALGEPHRLAIVDALRASDRTPSELGRLTRLPSNLLAFHLNVLEDAGLVTRRRSQGDGRRRYVTLRGRLPGSANAPSLPDGPVLFVCTRNAARSRMAETLWQTRTGAGASSAGAAPAEEVDPLARAVASSHGVELGDGPPRGYDDVEQPPALVVSVCDRAREGGLPWSVPALHWSISDPVGGSRTDYEDAFTEIVERIDRLATVAA